MSNPEKRRNSIINRYGSWEAYEEQRNKKIRETALARCTTEEERDRKILQFEMHDLLKSSVIPENIGKEIICTRCNNLFIAGGNQHLYCKKCILALARINNAKNKLTSEESDLNTGELLKKYFEHSQEKQNLTKLEKYGSLTYNNRDKAKKTCLERYNANSPLGVKEFIEKGKQTKLEKYDDENYNNREKAKETCLEVYGVGHVWKSEEVRNKCKETSIRTYGNYNNREKIKNTCFIRYGGNAPACSEEVHNKIRKTMKDLYGFEYPYQCSEFLKKAQFTWIRKYKVINPMMNITIKNSSMNTRLDRYGSFVNYNKYKYNNLYFDSSWELAFYIFLTDKKINFVYKPNPLSYLDSRGIPHRYFPDFYIVTPGQNEEFSGLKISNTYVEIKGDHLISPEGILIDHRGNKYFEKTKCLKDNNVLILTSKQIIPVLSYIKDKYGKNYLSSFKEKEKYDKNKKN